MATYNDSLAPAHAEAGGRTVEQYVGDTLDSARVSGTFWKIMALVASGYFVDVLDFTLFGSLVPYIAKSGIATTAQMPWIGSASALGLFIGSLAQGQLTDRFGRKAVYQFNLLLFGVATIGAAWAPDFFWLVIGRFIAGIGLGAEQPICFVYITEFSPKSIRGRLVAFMQFLGGSWPWPVGVLLALTLGDTLGWRWVWTIVGIGALIVFIFRVRLPESPRWLATHGKPQGALDVLHKMKLPTVPVEQLKMSAASSTKSDPFGVVFGKYPRRAIASMLCVAAFFGVSISFGAVAPHLLEYRGLSISGSLNLFFWMAMAAPVAQGLMIYTIEKMGRRLNVMVSFVLVALLAYAWANVNTFAMLLVVGFFIIFFIQLGGNSALVCISEVFPTNARGSGLGLATAAGRLSSFGTIPLLFWLLHEFGVQAVVLAMGAIALVAVIAITQLPEPRGQALDEIAPPTA